jgi:tRNA nucleotidyltransferase (CCA-adding enzyme)
MKIYSVGGAVRDALLGLPVEDRDWVVVGATPEGMLAKGFRPVGKDFPVFLHPKSHEEYALARTERKTAPGYAGFSFHAAPDVTLEDDLMRRDLTINAIAQDESGNLIDPYRGREDLSAGVLRHVSPAFSEDPVRILRVARFMARFTDFRVAPETMELMRTMTAEGEVDALVSERVWQEVSNGLMAAQPSRMFETLRECGALAKLMPELDALWGVPQRADYHPEVDTGVHMMMVLDMAARLNAPLPARFAALTHDLGKATTPQDILPRHHGHEQRSVDLLMPVCDRWRVPTECRDVARLTARYHGNLHCYADLRVATRLDILERCDALRRPERFDMVLLACEADYRGRLGWDDREYTQSVAWKADRETVRSVDAGAIAAGVADPKKLPDAIRAARMEALTTAR